MGTDFGIEKQWHDTKDLGIPAGEQKSVSQLVLGLCFSVFFCGELKRSS
jgi:hypothetical protein